MEDDCKPEIWCGKRRGGGGWCSRSFTKVGREAYGMGMWKDINKEATVFKQFCTFAAGDGRWVYFWEDTWNGMKPLSETFPNIYPMADSKGGFLTDFWDWAGERGVGI